VPIRTFLGPNLTTLLKQAQRTIGADAVILHTRRVRTPKGPAFELLAADPSSASRRVRLRPEGPAAALETMVPTLPSHGPLVIGLVGPTGSGKTTTLAKLATNPRVFGGRRVGVLSLDTYRVGALEQLGTYAAIGGLPLEVAYRLEDVTRIRTRFQDRDVILVDTPGRSPRNRRDRVAVEGLLVGLEPTEIHLVLPAAIPISTGRRLIADGRRIGVSHLLATKTDEAGDESLVFDLAVESGLPIRWETSGQEVPFDLGSAAESLEAVRLGRSDEALLVGEDVV
jgi:flagellar biosynthesis protein FlhF